MIQKLWRLNNRRKFYLDLLLSLIGSDLCFIFIKGKTLFFACGNCCFELLYRNFFFARLIYHLDNSKDKEDFRELQRSRRQRSYILIQIFLEDDQPNDCDLDLWNNKINSVANFCLIRRYDIDTFYEKKRFNKMKFLEKNNYLPEIPDLKEVIADNSILEFLNQRDKKLRSLTNEVFKFE